MEKARTLKDLTDCNSAELALASCKSNLTWLSEPTLVFYRYFLSPPHTPPLLSLVGYLENPVGLTSNYLLMNATCSDGRSHYFTFLTINLHSSLFKLQ